LTTANAVMMALAERLGRGAAHHAVQCACKCALDEHTPLIEMLT
jgi:N-acetyl-gamma-glutamylphosphate reductase